LLISVSAASRASMSLLLMLFKKFAVRAVIRDPTTTQITNTNGLS